MKSVLITFVMFAVIFGILKLDIASIFEGQTFFLISCAIFVIVTGVAIALFGLPNKKDWLSAIRIKRKDVEDEKDK